MIGARLNPGESLGDRILKVDHAGEHGAVNIYRGQLLVARLTATDHCREIAGMRAHEERHRAIFADELSRRGLRRCRSYWLCGAGGLLLGLATGLLGGSAIAATTAAVERVVLRHLDEQLATLSSDQAATMAIKAIIDDERQHHDLSLCRIDGDTLLVRAITRLVETSTEAVIWLGMKL
ncbi:MAG: demethoxyubiquinone hydroxylase family protein [Alphaproteobacteria bacterium]|nr:demethoxyubiquinone hydroxylase family protein [Alphaproteobacteria bacterium]MCW5741910.1 demethoxyubiquinone hydroxylase family protein [Alphaproteobacteria bacterium]